MQNYKLPLCFAFLIACTATGLAQGTPVPATEDAEVQATVDTDLRNQGSMLELGLTPVYSFLSSDVTSKGGYGLGLHARKSLDHLFSVRLDALYARSKGDNGSTDNSDNRRHDTNWYSGTAYGVMTLNNFKLKGDIRKVNVFLMAGAGFNYFGGEFQATGLPFVEDRNPTIDKQFQTHAGFGTGLNFRVSPRFNVGVEYQALVPLGKRADVVDGYDIGDFRDVQNIAGIALNFNIGNRDKLTEPRYWTNVFSPLKEDITNLNRRVDAATTDSDGDGIVDSVDQEPDTPSGVPVDSRGRTLDSDKDGVPDYRDLEPFFPPRTGEVVNADGVVTERIDAPLTQQEIQGLIDTSIARSITEGDRNANNSTRINMAGGAIYLPMIYFPLNSSAIKYDDYGMLASVARVMQANPEMRLIVRGYTDKTGNMDYNTRLSYRRALSVIDHLVDNSGIERSRLILQYRGQEEAIVPVNQSRVNRRVEFLTGIPGATEDAAPEGE